MCQVGRVAEALMKYGPRYTMISRETGVPVTTVRYIIREKLPKLGFTLHAAVNYGKLGLQGYLVKIESNMMPEYMCTLLDLFGEAMYLNYYTYLMKEKNFITIFTLPAYFEDSFIATLDKLVDLGLISRYSIKKLLYRRLLPLRAECFDYENGVWSMDWDESDREYQLPEVIEKPESIIKLSSIDLKILALIQENAFLKYSDIARSLRVTRQTVKRRYEKIIRVVDSYILLWVPRENPELVSTPIIVGVRSNSNTRRNLLRIPFIHLEMKDTDGDYYAMLFPPSFGFYKTIRYMSEKENIIFLDFLSMKYSANFLVDGLPYRDGEEWIDAFELITEKIVREVKLPR